MSERSNLIAITCLQNEALYDICTNLMKVKVPTHEDLNNVIAKVMAGFTSKTSGSSFYCRRPMPITYHLQPPCVSPVFSTRTCENWLSTWCPSLDCISLLSVTLLW